jgi:cytochrome c oxidase cbb3-type subunit 3
MQSLFRKLLLVAFVALPATLHGAPEAPAAAAKNSGLNMTLVLLMSLALVLMAGIGVLANVMKSLAYLHMDKMKSEREGSTLAKAAVMLLAFVCIAGGVSADEAVQVAEEIARPVSPFISGIPRAEFYFVTGLIAFEVLAILTMVFQINGLLKALHAVPEKAPIVRRILKKNYLDIFNKSVAVEKEQVILMEHEYDGIRELDNSLPPWWKWGFVFTVLVSVAYMWYYHVGDGPNQHEEYIAAVEKAEIEKAEYLAKSSNNVDENTIAMTDDASVIEAGKQLFQTSCAACHSADGGGTVGPNLTDDYWLHGGSIKDVFVSVKYGWPDKGMKSWKDDFSPKQLASIATYIKTLKGTKPAAPKEPQGDLYVEGSNEAAPANDAAKEGVTKAEAVPATAKARV